MDEKTLKIPESKKVHTNKKDFKHHQKAITPINSDTIGPTESPTRFKINNPNFIPGLGREIAEKEAQKVVNPLDMIFKQKKKNEKPRDYLPDGIMQHNITETNELNDIGIANSKVYVSPNNLINTDIGKPGESLGNLVETVSVTSLNENPPIPKAKFVTLNESWKKVSKSFKDGKFAKSAKNLTRSNKNLTDSRLKLSNKKRDIEESRIDIIPEQILEKIRVLEGFKKDYEAVLGVQFLRDLNTFDNFSDKIKFFEDYDLSALKKMIDNSKEQVDMLESFFEKLEKFLIFAKKFLKIKQRNTQFLESKYPDRDLLFKELDEKIIRILERPWMTHNMIDNINSGRLVIKSGQNDTMVSLEQFLQ